MNVVRIIGMLAVGPLLLVAFGALVLLVFYLDVRAVELLIARGGSVPYMFVPEFAAYNNEYGALPWVKGFFRFGGWGSVLLVLLAVCIFVWLKSFCSRFQSVNANIIANSHIGKSTKLLNQTRQSKE